MKKASGFFGCLGGRSSGRFRAAAAAAASRRFLLSVEWWMHPSLFSASLQPHSSHQCCAIKSLCPLATVCCPVYPRSVPCCRRVLWHSSFCYSKVSDECDPARNQRIPRTASASPARKDMSDRWSWSSGAKRAGAMYSNCLMPLRSDSPWANFQYPREYSVQMPS